MHGILLLDKPTGIGSRSALNQIIRHFKPTKAGYIGTLDPLASGMLPLVFGEATKFADYIVSQKKSYQVTMKFGFQTNTGDAQGAVIANALNYSPILAGHLNQVLENFKGQYSQIPPYYSSLRTNGQRWHKIARAGGYIRRQARPVVINEICLKSYHWPYLSFQVSCSKGTYMRVLSEDIAHQCKTVGTMLTLRRLWQAPFEHGSMLPLDTALGMSCSKLLQAPAWLPLNSCFSSFPEVVLKRSNLRDFPMSGYDDEIKPGSYHRVVTRHGHFLGLIKVDDNHRILSSRWVKDLMIKKYFEDNHEV
jgi:tRNA pseudouridine55 synthase